MVDETVSILIILMINVVVVMWMVFPECSEPIYRLASISEQLIYAFYQARIYSNITFRDVPNVHR